jgi:GT2 family glycosyltransferase
VVDNGSTDGTAELVRARHPDVQVVCQEMADSPLQPADDLPGPPLLGFIACGAVVRRDAFLEVGGFDARLGVGGEEELLALDLAARGWGLAYVDEVVAHHYPSPSRVKTQAEMRRGTLEYRELALLRDQPATAATRPTSPPRLATASASQPSHPASPPPGWRSPSSSS